jgi:hypothetical protein
MRSGVIKAPPPTPVSPMRRPTAKPAPAKGSRAAAQLRSIIDESLPLR